MPIATITAKGQLTLPKQIREQLGVDVGDRVDFVVHTDGRVTVEPAVQAVGRLKGLLARAGRRPVSVAAMHAAIRQRASARR